MQVPKNFPATQDTQQSFSYGNGKENPTGSMGLIDFAWACFFPLFQVWGTDFWIKLCKAYYKPSIYK